MIQVFNFLVELINQTGYLGVLFGMTIGSSLFPFPSEVILIPAGALIARNEMSFLIVFFLSVIGSLLGAYFNYFLAYFLGRKTVDCLIEKYGSFIFLKKESLIVADNFFQHHGSIATFLGRLLPIIKQIISLPAGFARMGLWKFTYLTIIGSAIWTLLLIAIGYFFQTNYELIKDYVNAFLVMVVLIIIVFYYNKYQKYKKKKI
jgi:membrane protein DedA with SNARE-associated domain